LWWRSGDCSLCRAVPVVKEIYPAKDEIVKSKEAEIASLKTQISSVGSAKDDALKAKDAHIAVLEREIKGLQEFSLTKLREYALSVKQGYKEAIGDLEGKVEKRDIAINELQLENQSNLAAYA
jgi:hypothetical protein